MEDGRVDVWWVQLGQQACYFVRNISALTGFLASLEGETLLQVGV